MQSDKNANSFEQLEKAAVEYNNLDDSAFIAHLKVGTGTPVISVPDEPMRVEGALFLILVRGSVRVNYNFEEFIASGPSTISFGHGSMAQLRSVPTEPLDMYVLKFSPLFMQDINISFSAISSEALVDRKSPVFDLRDREIALTLRYISLMQSVISDSFNSQLSRHTLSSLTSALFYQMMQFLYRRIEITDNESIGSRRASYVHDFLKLVHLYYTKERSVNFYASKLFISPKYLSLLVKEATGKSAARWIDHFVITEAKNLLRYSGKNIQQVAYALNFSNQSSFGKYFKHLTGQSPTEFQKS